MNHPLHEVSGTALPDDARRLCPLIGNDELKLCVDARGVMHDVAHVWPSHPPPRITRSGRRHNLRQDRYSSNLFEWGFLDLHLQGEERLPPVGGWRQRLHPREGLVETEIRRGDVTERTLSLVHLERNLIVFRREYRNLPALRNRCLRAVYRLCQVGTDTLPFRVRWKPGRPQGGGIAADTEADGLQIYRGRIALFADVHGRARAVGNRLELTLRLPPSGAVTVYLSLLDDLGDDPQILRIPFDAWMNPHVREVHRENTRFLDRLAKPDPSAATDALRAWVHRAGFEGVSASHRRAWAAFWRTIRIRLPPEEQTLTAALETQAYTLRCSSTRYSLPANPFNTSWGAAYFWDERFGVEGLMTAGSWEMPKRAIEWRRRLLPFSTLMTAGRGARYVSSATETGAHISDRNGTQFYEFFQIGVFVNYIRQYCRYRDTEEVWRRYYPVFRECAEFYRRWLLVELPGNHLMVVPLIDVDEGVYPVQDGPFTVCGAARILHTAWSVAERLGIQDPEVSEWKRLGGMALHLANHLCNPAYSRPPSAGEDRPILAGNPSACFTDYELGDIPLPDLAMDEAVRTWRDRARRATTPPGQMQDGKSNVTGEFESLPFWSWGPLQLAHSAATLGQPDEALAHLKNALKTMMDFGALNESAKTDLSDVHHPWFTTAAGAYLRALTRMLLYTADREVRIAPGIPAAWREFAFDLPLHLGGRVRVEVRDGVLARLTLTERKADPPVRRVHLPKRFLKSGQSFVPPARVAADTAEELVIETGVARGAHELLP